MLVVAETKLDESFSAGQFWISAYTFSFCLDRDQHGGGIMTFTWEDIPVKFLSADTKLTEDLYIEVNIHKWTWLLTEVFTFKLSNHAAIVSGTLWT